jgi:hypothetical protein
VIVAGQEALATLACDPFCQADARPFELPLMAPSSSLVPSACRGIVTITLASP